MKNLIFSTTVLCVALLAGCPNGNGPGEGEGEGTVGEGEGSSQIVANIDVTVPTTVDTKCNVFVSQNPNLANFSTPSDFAQAIAGLTPDCSGKAAGEQCTVSEKSPTVADYFVALDCGPDHLATVQKVHVTASGPYTTNWSSDGECGFAPEGTYDNPSEFASTQISTTVDLLSTGSSALVIHDTVYFPQFIQLLVAGNTFGGEGTDTSTGVHVTATGTISSDLCTITYDDTRSDGTQTHHGLSRTPPCSN